MSPTIPIEELRAELDSVLKSISLLTAVCANLQAFLDNYHGRLGAVIGDNLEMYREMLAGRETIKAQLQDELEQAINRK